MKMTKERIKRMFQQDVNNYLNIGILYLLVLCDTLKEVWNTERNCADCVVLSMFSSTGLTLSCSHG